MILFKMLLNKLIKEVKPVVVLLGVQFKFKKGELSEISEKENIALEPSRIFFGFILLECLFSNSGISALVLALVRGVVVCSL